MFLNQLINFLSFIFFIWFLVQLIRATLYWLYLWQIKEYRLDRIRAHLSLPFGKKQLLAIFFPFSLSFWRKPSLTLRLVLVLFFMAVIEFRAYFLILKLMADPVRRWPLLLFPAFSISLVILFFTTAFFIALANGLAALALEPLYALLIYFAKKRLETIKPLVIGVTGSFGKTATKEILAKLLICRYQVLATQRSVNTSLGVVKVILTQLKSRHEVFIVEMGAYQKGEIKKLADLVKPKIGIITGINPQHQQLFGSQEQIIQTKYELIQALPKDGFAFFNGDNPICLKLFKKTKKVKAQAYYFPLKNYPTFLLGKFQQQNIQGALVIAEYMGIDRKKALKEIRTMTPSAMMLKSKMGLKNCRILDDSHNANPDGFWEALEILESLKAKRKVVVTSGVIELGEQTQKVHQRLGKKIAQVAEKLILTNDNFYLDFLTGAGKDFKRKIEVIENKEKLKKRLKNIARKKTVILLEGRNWEAQKILFNR